MIIHLIHSTDLSTGGVAEACLKLNGCLNLKNSGSKITDDVQFELNTANFIIAHGLWQWPSYQAWKNFKKTGVPYIVFPHGMLDPWFKKTYPDVEVEESTSNSYLLQTMTGMQGEKDVGRGWYIQMKDTLVNGFGMIVCPAEPALFVKHYPGGDIFLLCTSTDDFLCAFSKEYIFADFMKFMDSVLPVTAQTGKVLKYLNVRIIQTDMGISIDQTQHIKTNVIEKFFPPNRTDRLKSANTPYRSDSEYERALSETLPARGQELTNLELLFGGSFHSLVGVLLHIQQVTRFEIGFAITRDCLSSPPVPTNQPSAGSTGLQDF